ncbi:hypothetical protein HJC23_002726 [Cyclotella cryptica]|uniref:Uncharacterized protein n=1 Tax=Cyclotella cryptica TaxID=29204 RepID=A0ABD3PDD2_9STRA
MSSIYVTESGASVVCSGAVVVCSQYSQYYGPSSIVSLNPQCYAQYATSSPAIFLQPSMLQGQHSYSAYTMPVCARVGRKKSRSASTRAYESRHQAPASTPTAMAKTYDNASAPPLELLMPTMAPSYYRVECSQNS